MVAYPKIESNILRAISALIGDTNSGLTGTEMTKYLRDSGIDDPSPGITKRDRLFDALHQKQEQDRCSNNVFAFIKKVMHPSNYANNEEMFDHRRHELNVQLAFVGWRVTEKGELESVVVAQTIDEAKERAGRLRKKLQERKIHSELLKYCREELLKENYFHAVLEASKSIAERVREMSSLTEDGGDLIAKAFGLGANNQPKLAVNFLSNGSEISEHKGFANFLVGVFGMFRNVTAHAPKIKWAINEDDAVEALAVISFAHKKLDECYKTPW
ncbi:MAG: TIGR02391 family protein [Bacteroidetes bacterium]|nr:TIGR02391 family protein [Bacteroidota bacterium]